MEKKFNWFGLLWILMDLFWIWYNLSFMFDYIKENHNIAAIFGTGVILWTLCLLKDGNDFRNNK